MQDYDKTKQHLDDNNLCGCAMRQQLPVSDFKWSEDKIDEILETNEDSEKGILQKLIWNIQMNYVTCIMIIR